MLILCTRILIHIHLTTHFFEEYEGIGQDQFFSVLTLSQWSSVILKKKPSDVIKYGFEKSENQNN